MGGFPVPKLGKITLDHFFDDEDFDVGSGLSAACVYELADMFGDWEGFAGHEAIVDERWSCDNLSAERQYRIKYIGHTQAATWSKADHNDENEMHKAPQVKLEWRAAHPRESIYWQAIDLENNEKRLLYKKLG